MSNASGLADNPAVHRLPPWFKQPIADPVRVDRLKSMFRFAGLHTVCESARCPNLGKCWGAGVATFMILGEICTRACRFCAVQAGRPTDVDPQEPFHVAMTVKELNLRYVVITSVARDDLPDEGAEHFAQTIHAIRKITPKTKIEVLIPDFSAKPDCLKTVVQAQPEVISHNIETVERLSPKVRPQAAYRRSLDVLRQFKELGPTVYSKSSLMLGLGETPEEVEQVMKDLRAVNCDILTIGQYLAPTRLKRHLPVDRFYTPEEFDNFRKRGKDMGFKHVMGGPLVRSSYIAEEGYRECVGSVKPRGAGILGKGPMNI